MINIKLISSEIDNTIFQLLELYNSCFSITDPVNKELGIVSQLEFFFVGWSMFVWIKDVLHIPRKLMSIDFIASAARRCVGDELYRLVRGWKERAKCKHASGKKKHYKSVSQNSFVPVVQCHKCWLITGNWRFHKFLTVLWTLLSNALALVEIKSSIMFLPFFGIC